ncbi:MAG: precorrin-4 C(11)-methyltransferase [Burkholderia sp.]|nr:precorrin-4 C(11)-methyltransferase [Burkholderia sp.]
MTVYFIGAGPGDPELITVKGQRLVRSCKVILYAGSLVPDAVLNGHQAHIVNTANLDLDEIINLFSAAHSKGQDVARVHSGDPSLYSTISEQIRRIKLLEIPYEIIPGVTSTSACAAALGCELTLPGITQTIILTRYARKTKISKYESLSALSSHQATLAIHLSIRHLSSIVDDILPHYGEDCPVAVVYRASWPDEISIIGTLSNIVSKIKCISIKRTALILIGRVLDKEGFTDSTLYSRVACKLS